MPTRPRQELLDEATEWIAEQMTEEGMVITGGFVDLVLSMEWDAIEAGQDPDDRAGMVRALCERMNREDVRIGPPPDTLSTDGVDLSLFRAVPPQLVQQILSWEDDFLGFAGISRNGG